MNLFLFCAVFLLSPISFSHTVEVKFQGNEKIVAPDFSDVDRIFELSKQLPSLYEVEKRLPSEPLAFRTRDIYQRLIKGEDIRANALKQKHTFLVFKDKKGGVQGYIHGWVDLETNEATLDELVVDEEWRGKNIAHALIGKILVHFESLDSSVTVTSRIPFSKKMFEKFGVQVREKDFDTIFIVDHLLSRFSIRYFMYQNRTAAPKHQAVADELHKIISKAPVQDSFSIDQAMKYLAKLADAMNEEIKARSKKAGKEIYSGIQDDKYDIANVYFVMTLMSFLSEKDSSYYQLRETYLNEMIEEVREAQKEGGILPVNLQFFIARVYAFIPFLHQEKRGSQTERQWVQKSIRQYLRLMELENVILSSAHIQTMICEILWCQYEYAEAMRMAADFTMHKKEILDFLKKNEELMTPKKEEQIASFLSPPQKEGVVDLFL